MRRYFIHRTGVEPSECVKINLEQELIRAQSNRNFHRFFFSKWNF